VWKFYCVHAIPEDFLGPWLRRVPVPYREAERISRDIKSRPRPCLQLSLKHKLRTYKLFSKKIICNAIDSYKAKYFGKQSLYRRHTYILSSSPMYLATSPLLVVLEILLAIYILVLLCTQSRGWPTKINCVNFSPISLNGFWNENVYNIVHTR
jgi:hypothetical protein